MAEEHGLYKGSAPGERARGVKNNGGLLRRGRTSLLCQCCNSKVLSAEKLVFLSLPFYFPRLGNVHNPRAASGHGADPGSFHKQIRSLKCFLASNDCEVWSFAGWKRVLRWSCGEKKEKSKALWPCLKPLFCMASHNCELKITDGEKTRSKALKKLVKKPLFCSAGHWEVFNLQLWLHKQNCISFLTDFCSANKSQKCLTVSRIE